MLSAALWQSVSDFFQHHGMFLEFAELLFVNPAATGHHLHLFGQAGNGRELIEVALYISALVCGRERFLAARKSRQRVACEILCSARFV